MKHKPDDINSRQQPSNFTKKEPSFIDGIKLDESFEILTGHGGVKKLFLKRFNDRELYRIMEKTGLPAYLKKAGFDRLILDHFVDENRINYLKLYSREKIHENQLFDIRLSETTFIPDKKFFRDGIEIIPYEMINIEWISSRNPFKNFDDSKPQLPGQESPGLGILQFCFNVLYIIAREIYKDGFLDIPDHMHSAIMYSSKFKFFDPVHEAILRAVMRDLAGYSISDISWGIITGTVIEEHTGQPQVYDPCEQVHYVSRRMKKYFQSTIYRDTFRKYYNRRRYHLEYDEMQRRRTEILNMKKIEDL